MADYTTTNLGKQSTKVTWIGGVNVPIPEICLPADRRLILRVSTGFEIKYLFARFEYLRRRHSRSGGDEFIQPREVLFGPANRREFHFPCRRNHKCGWHMSETICIRSWICFRVV